MEKGSSNLLSEVNGCDPMTREPCTVDDLRPNLALKALIDRYESK
jgi:hypothetical protein